MTAYITEHLMADTSIESIAQELNIRYYYMCHVFKNKNDVSVNTYRTQKRLEIAMRKLINTDEKIADIATSSGFNNVSYFAEIFTKMTGISPTMFRVQNKDVSLHRFLDYYDIRQRN